MRVGRATMLSASSLSQHESLSPEIAGISSGKNTAIKAVREVSHDAAQSIQRVWSREDLPQWMQSDPYILRGYRCQLDSFSACVQSIFYLHNESVNIWSHLSPTLAYLAVLLATDYSALHTGVDLSTADNTILQTYVFCCISCLAFSVCLALSERMKRRD